MPLEDAVGGWDVTLGQGVGEVETLTLAVSDWSASCPPI